MADIIWGNGLRVISRNSFVLSTTHRKNGNKQNYSDYEKIQIISADLPELPDNESEWDERTLENNVIDVFLKCEIDKRNEQGALLAKVSHSGVGGY